MRGVMNVSEWGHLWGAATVLFGHEPMEFRVAMVLAAAFTALMAVEGLRASFIPRRTRSMPQPVITPSHPIAAPVLEPPPQRDASTKVLVAVPGDAAQHLYAPARKFVQQNRKRETSKPRAHRNMRPRIRRMVTAHEQDSMPS